MSGMTIEQALAVIQTEVNYHAGSDTHYRAERLEQSLTTLRAEIEALRAEFDESCATINKLTKLLAETAIVIKGPEPEATKWSYHDIPDGVRAIQARAERLAEVLKEAEEYIDAKTPSWYGPGQRLLKKIRDLLCNQEEGHER